MEVECQRSFAAIVCMANKIRTFLRLGPNLLNYCCEVLVSNKDQQGRLRIPPREIAVKQLFDRSVKFSFPFPPFAFGYKQVRSIFKLEQNIGLPSFVESFPCPRGCGITRFEK